MNAVNGLLRLVGTLSVPGGSNAKLSVVYHHRVLAVPDPLQPGVPDARLFDAWMARCAAIFRVMPLEEAVQRLAAGTLPARTACITFDDGYRDNYEIALPILRRHRLTATFFIADGFLGQGRMFNDTVVEWVRRLRTGVADLSWTGLGTRHVDDLRSRIRLIGELVSVVKYASSEKRDFICRGLEQSSEAPLPDDLMMTADQVRAMRSEGMSIGGHTVSHPILSRIEPERARWEIETNRSTLAALLDGPPRLFAYPNGKPLTDYRAEHVEAVRAAGYEAAFTTAYGAATPAHDPMQLPRISPRDGSAIRYAAKILRGTASAPL